MPYRCPVCETLQADAEHLAHHLAVTAMLHGEPDERSTDPHAAWLSEHADGWTDESPADLASRVTDHVEPAEGDDGDPLLEDGRDHGGDPRRASRPNLDPVPEHVAAGERGRMDEAVADVLEEARELTERMRDEAKDE